MRTGVIACLVLICVTPSRGQTDAEVCAQAEAAFRQGVEHKTQLLEARKHFSQAADAYLELHRRGVRSPGLYANFGNAAVLANRWPEAIWAYHMGLRLDPNDRMLRDHLAFTRNKVLYPPANQGRLDAEVWPIWLHRPTIHELSWLIVFSYLLAWLAGMGAFLTRRLPCVLLTGVLIIILALAGIGLRHEWKNAAIDRETLLVILAANTEFYRGNGTNYPQHPVLPILPRGLEVRQLHRRGAWLQIRLNTGETGWVPRGQVLIVEP